MECAQCAMGVGPGRAGPIPGSAPPNPPNLPPGFPFPMPPGQNNFPSNSWDHAELPNNMQMSGPQRAPSDFGPRHFHDPQPPTGMNSLLQRTDSNTQNVNPARTDPSNPSAPRVSNDENLTSEQAHRREMKLAKLLEIQKSLIDILLFSFLISFLV